ncbi:Kef-type K+ transport system membrane component KefB [Clostridium acetobutylicum]|uniref:Na/H antiporter (NapA) n=2 Tax=Bacteria TaxID=2 RepID=Q97LW0_CLOAB|nr:MULTISPECIES: cation:proton antiporter [Clostridium]AAK78424.1 Na/H antiporter (napA) [Clostridium acetobutylicum ATCC 824]ADZ19494.1 Na/H antiporter (napA) [Clostridium acetobutylicum EA 2018]AEI34224.1 Na/H antiporter (napA) [Clostridium acetobutylicum DSM 1731]AWV80146.1 cation:proton antiporter [Clostridium acetobutylicum]MBC2392327.1 cation:proton antiporter [Clostridium acetobutylicum]
MDKILFDIALILIFTKIGSLISIHFKMPGVLGELIAGVILGPFILNLIQANADIKLLSDLGVVFLMFLAGIETNLDELKKAGKSSFLIALGGIIIPLIVGTLSAYMFFSNFYENLFVGVILTATSVSISVQTLTELGKLNTRSGINILGAAIIDDVLGLILITVVLAISGGTKSHGSSIFMTFIYIGIFCLVSLLAIAFLPKPIDKLTQKFKPQKGLAIFSIAAALICAFTAEKLGIAAITGAYICGLVLSPITHKEYIEKRVKIISTSFLSPIFFASVGISASVKGLNFEVLLITLIMFIIAVIGKILGCSASALTLKFKKSEALQIGVGMVSRGEVAIITANIGLQAKIISEEIFLPTLIVVILTTVITPILLKIVFSHKTQKLIDKETLT